MRSVKKETKVDANNRQEAYQSLISLANKQGYVTFDDIMESADNYSLPIQDFDWLSNAITTRGILVYSDNPNLQNTDETEYDDFAQCDYEAVYNRLIELRPSLETLVTQVRNTLPPQQGEVSRLKYQIVDGNLHARNRLIEMHLRVALRIALSRAELFDLDIEDTISDAFVGLTYAVDKYDPDTSGPFSSYASLWILQNVSRMQDTQRPLVYYPVHRKEGYIAIYPIAKSRGCIGCDKIGSCQEMRELIIQRLNCSEVEVGYVTSQMTPFVSENDLLRYEKRAEKTDFAFVSERTLRFLASNMEEEILTDIYHTQISEKLYKVLDSLTARERKVISLRRGLDGNDEMTLEEIGQLYHLTRERIRQIEARAIRKIKRKIMLMKDQSSYLP